MWVGDRVWLSSNNSHWLNTICKLCQVGWKHSFNPQAQKYLPFKSFAESWFFFSKSSNTPHNLYNLTSVRDVTKFSRDIMKCNQTVKWRTMLIIKLALAHGSVMRGSRGTARIFFFSIYFNKGWLVTFSQLSADVVDCYYMVHVPGVLFSLFPLCLLILTFFSDPQFSSLLVLNGLHWGRNQAQLFIQNFIIHPRFVKASGKMIETMTSKQCSSFQHNGEKRYLVLMLTDPWTEVLILRLPPAVPPH